MADLAQQAAQSYQPPGPLAGTAALANAVVAAPPPAPPAPAPFVPPADPTVASGVPAIGQPIAGAPAQDSTIVVTPSPAPPPKVTVVPKPPGPPSAQPAGIGGVTPPSPELQGLMASATAPADPNGDAVDQELAADAADRGRPSANPAKPGDLAASGAAATAAGQAQSQALRETGEADQQAAAAETRAREQQARELEQKAAEQKLIRDQASAHVQQLREKAAKEPYHTLFEGEPGNMVLAGIGILLGSASYSANHVNQATGLIDRAIAQNFQVQQAKHAQLWKDVETAMEEGKQLRSDQLDEMANFRARQAATLDAVIAKGRELSGRAKNKEMAAALDAKNAQLAFERDKAYDEVSRLKAAQLETERHNKADEGIGRAKVGIEGARLRMEKGNAEEIKVARALDTQLGKDKVTTGRLDSLNKLQEAKAAIATGNPVAIQGAFDAYIRSQTGLGARPASIKMFQERLGGALDQLNAWVTEKRSGALPASMVKRFENAVDAATTDNVGALKKAKALHEKALLASPEYARHADLVRAHLEDRFSAINGVTPTEEAPPGAVKGTLNGKRGYVLNGQFTAFQ